ncbi:MAG: DNA polymerase/3'-5' exonuclease PolX [Acidobacteria bacterium]|nr:DNA polymerase/3'-5' exonuclease PolX [Acidobacteriota bacterium]
MENAALARLLGDIGDLLEIAGENPFKIRAYRNAADIVTAHATRVTDLPVDALLELPGIGRDLALRIREAGDTGGMALHRDLLARFPASMLDLLRLQGVGPKTVKRLHDELGIDSIDGLEAAASAGRIRALKGMGAKKERAILEALENRRRYAGRHLLAHASAVADGLVERLVAAGRGGSFDVVGSLRRGTETCGDLDVLAVGADPSIMDVFVGLPDVERVLGHGPTKSSVQLGRGLQVDLRLVPVESRGAALQYFTGSKAHNIALRDRAIARGLRLNEYGLFRQADEGRVAGASEDDIYAALDLAWIPPALREGRGELDAAERGSLPRLVSLADLRGDVHLHTTATDGRDDIETMVLAARDRGLEYVAITDHSQALAMANGLDERRALEHAARIREVGRRVEGITVFAGIECDILPDGRLDLADDCLAALDFVIASVHSAFGQERQQMTDRILRALECRWVDALGHPTGRRLLARAPYEVDVERLIEAAASHGVALEINAQPDRLDLGDVHARLARDRGVPILLATDAHSAQGLDAMRWAVAVAERAWLEAGDVLNTKPALAFRRALRRARSSSATR